MKSAIPTLTTLVGLATSISALAPAAIGKQTSNRLHWSPVFYRKRREPKSDVITDTKITEDEVRQLFSLWSDALGTLDPDVVTRRYSSDAVLLPTLSNKPRTDYESIKDYFVTFLANKPQGRILESHITLGDLWCSDVGIYKFTMGTTGESVKARYSFIYGYEDGEWKISHHHSSKMPEAKTTNKIDCKQVRELFNLWNDALCTLDPDAVAQRYSKKAVLLPTVSDTPRTDYDSIRDYFVTFLQREPKGEIVESYVTSGGSWCKDVGIYKFTMGTDNSVVAARYTFLYVLENGEWKISHHHSSVLPEGMLED
eukprot:scaffold197_cov129-Cylindrotheca_fusiformis.AAC.4